VTAERRTAAPVTAAPVTAAAPVQPAAAPASAHVQHAVAATAAPARTASTPSTAGFTDLGVPAVLAKALAAQGIDAPFPIQTATLPDSMAGRDVLGRGRTGSGKTLAFSLPLVTRLVGGTRHPRQPRALVLVPTRELANQVHAVVEPLVRAVGLTSTVVFGGVGQNPQVKALASGVDVLIACPGRLEDLIGRASATCPESRSPSWTRPTTWPTWASCPPSSDCSTAPRRAVSGCCSPRRSTTASTCWSSATSPRR
jgi:ATP-dependent helicase YprA (DUF1998 family)